MDLSPEPSFPIEPRPGSRALAPGKVQPPPLPPAQHPREALVRRILAGRGQTLTLLAAPPGFGKTLTLSHCYEALDSRLVRRCWLTLDAADRDPTCLMHYLRFSLEAGGALTDRELLEPPACSRPRGQLDRLLGALTASGRCTVLMLDGLEVLDRGILKDLLLPLLDYAPPQLRVLAATRNQAFLRGGRLEAQGRLQCFTAAELRLGPEEVLAFLGLPAGSGEAAESLHLTRGWPVAVGLLRDALRHDRDRRRALQSLEREDGPLARLIDEEILAEVDEAALDLLEAAACLEAPTADAITRLLGHDNGGVTLAGQQHRLAGLLAAGGPEAAEPELMLHPLLRSRLLLRLARRRPSRHLAWQLAASEWCHERGDLLGAVRHALRAGRPGAAGALVLRAGGISLWLREGMTRIRSALTLLPGATIARNPRLLLLQSIVDIKEGRVADAVRNHRRAEKLAPTHPEPPEDATLLREELALIEAYVAIYAGRRIRETSYRFVLESTERLRGLDDDRLAFHYTLLCVMNTQAGDFSRAGEFADEAIQVFRDIDSLYGETYIYFHAGDMRFAAGDSEGAEANYRRGLDLARRHFREDKGMRLVAHTLLIELMDELGRSDYSAAILRSLPAELEAREAWFEIYAAGYCTATAVESRTRGIDAALRILDRADAYADSQQLGPLQALLRAQRITLLAQAGHLREGRELLDHLDQAPFLVGRTSGEAGGWRAMAARTIARASLLLAEGRAGEALSEITASARHSEAMGHQRPAIRYAVLQSLALQALGDTDTALHTAREGIEAARSSGFIRALLDAGAGFDDLLAEIRGAGVDPATEAFIEQLRHRRGQGEDTGRGSEVGHELSERERCVLEHVAAGLTNKQIGRAVGISENTVRFHLKRCFRKLRVHNRTHAARLFSEQASRRKAATGP